FAIMVPIAKTMPVFSFVPSVMMALTIAFSIDYSLFLLSRYKEEIQKGKDVDTAIFLMLKHAGHTISVSGITLIVSFIGLTFFPLGLLATIGIGASVSVLVTLIVNLTLIPAILYIFPQFFSKFLQVKIPYRKNRKKLKKTKEDIWIQTGRDATKYAIPIILIVLVITIPISVQTMKLEATLDYSHILPRHADSMAAYKIIKDSFSPGMLGPMYILIVTNETNGVLTQSYFNVSATLVEYLTFHTSISLSSFIGISYAQGTKIDFVQALFLLSPESPLYNTTEARMYREMFNRYTNFDNSSTIIEVQPNFDPFGAYVETWIKEARQILDYFFNTTPYTFYLAGGSTDVVDAVDLAYDIFPTMIGVVLAVIYIVIAIMFQSLLVPLRLIFTVVLTISWIYGLAALIFDVGILDFISAPLRDVSSLYWATPIMSFSILIGLGLDYDIFLVSRISEFRDYGFTEKDSIIKGLSKTGRIITMAGIIMAIAFSGLMLSGSMVMNEFGFVLCTAVLLDTFLIRTILVPAIMSIAEKFNWWPSKKPKPDKKFEDEI
ncbi:MAG: MMPL family transporter, partial [Candidatus Heimdallarchaeaceae archaeon]